MFEIKWAAGGLREKNGVGLVHVAEKGWGGGFDFGTDLN